MTAPATKRQPIPFGKYLLLDRINIGGMAEVWRGKMFGAGGFERLIAIKRILPNIAEDAEFISMFIDEAKITAQLAHANIGQVFDLGEISNNYYIAMEYISGKDMRAIFDRCRKKGEPPPIPLACYLIAKAAEGLDYAHRKADGRGNLMNIVHRDVSPQNALVSYDGEVKVIDFGIAKAAGKATKTQAGILKGKFGYMSPEQIRGLPLDRRSDVFAIGVCLYEMLTGERLFVGDSDFSVLEKVRKVEVLPPSTYNRKIPEGLEKIVMKALAKDVDDRYQYASEVADDLQRFLITTETVFGRKDLSQYMKATFAEDVEKEKARLSEYADIQAPEGMKIQDTGGFSGASSAPSMQSIAPPAASPMGPPMITPSGRANVSAARAPVPPRPEAPRKPSGGPSVPRLTAVAPLLTSRQEQHEATMLVGPDGQVMTPGQDHSAAMPGDTGFDAEDEAALGNLREFDAPPEEEEDEHGTVPMMPSHDKTVARPHAPAPPPAATPPMPDRPAAPPQRQPPAAQRRPPPPSSRPQPNFAVIQERNSAPARANHPGSEPSQVTQAPRRGVPKSALIAALVGLVVVGGAGAGWVLLGKAEGLLVVELPEELSGRASITVNGEDLFEADGTPIKSFPVMRKVKAGKASVMIKAPGYRTLLETVDVKEGGEYSRLKQRLIKSGGDGSAPGPGPTGAAPGSPGPPGPPAAPDAPAGLAPAPAANP